MSAAAAGCARAVSSVLSVLVAERALARARIWQCSGATTITQSMLRHVCVCVYVGWWRQCVCVRLTKRALPTGEELPFFVVVCGYFNYLS